MAQEARLRAARPRLTAKKETDLAFIWGTGSARLHEPVSRVLESACFLRRISIRFSRLQPGRACVPRDECQSTPRDTIAMTGQKLFRIVITAIIHGRPGAAAIFQQSPFLIMSALWTSDDGGGAPAPPPPRHFTPLVRTGIIELLFYDLSSPPTL
ncbi:hypothetical protein EVAR_23627_1 [Eumeta japonica]|uniref:Uncharacterized protein n=1 Tax=Eumeta variegata TaxID=151549 RepID=A0A4C1VKM8_EUMVA|nr:hypothetical protein EVAR_23627_1 [Eumeta japonica]